MKYFKLEDKSDIQQELLNTLKVEIWSGLEQEDAIQVSKTRNYATFDQVTV